MLHFNQQGFKMSLESDKVAGEIASTVVTGYCRGSLLSATPQ